jgi:uncharacterized membrane protein YgcG
LTLTPFSFLAIAFIFSFSVHAQERVLSFNSQIQIGARGELSVLETIAVQVEGQQIKRGILRDFPTDYQDRFGRKVTVPFDVLSVKRDGQAEPYSLQRQTNGVSVRIGNANVMLPRGRHVYEIAYRTNFQVGFFDQHDELYWNVNGNGWTFAMDEISAEVSLPGAAVPAAQLKVEAYTGPFGAKGRDYSAEALSGGASFRSTRRLGAGEGLTIVVMFPKGIVAPPTLRSKFDRWLKDNLGEAVGAAGLLVFLAFLYWRWAAVGKDPRAGPLFPRYEAPGGIGPAGARYLDKMACDDRCFAAALLGLGQRGYLRIKEDRGMYELERIGNAMQWLPGEAAVAVLAPAQGSRFIGGVYDPLVAQVRGRLQLDLQKHFDERLFSLNRGSIAIAVLIGGATLVAMQFLHAPLLVIVAACVVMLAALVLAWKLLPAYTVEGRRLDDEIEGLRQYLSVAESDDLVRAKRPPRTKEEFAKFLPYAVALGLEKTWADAFAKVLGASALAAATSGYYASSTSSSDSSSMFGSSSGFTDSIADMGRTISAASTPPGSSSGGSSSGGSSSSSSSSGGSSGGGGGGGGGSGW